MPINLAFYRALAARNGGKVPHFQAGGELGNAEGTWAGSDPWGGVAGYSSNGGPGPGSASDQVSQAGGQASDAGKGVGAGLGGNNGQAATAMGHGSGGFLGQLASDPLGALAAHNNYNQNLPGITQTDWAPGMATGAARSNQGDINSQNAFRNIYSAENNVNGAAASLGAPGGVMSQQQALANALSAQAQGRGPNPAQEQFKQNLGNAITQQNGAIASTKGLNPALAARMAADNTAGMTQGAASNAAQLQAQQQLGAQAALGGQQKAMADTIAAQGGLYHNAGQLAGGAGQIANGETANGNQFFGENVGGQGAQNSAITSGTVGTGIINAGVSAGNAQARGAITGGILSGIGAFGPSGIMNGAGAGAAAGGGGGGGSAPMMSDGTGTAATNSAFNGPPAMAHGGMVGHYSSGGLMSLIPLVAQFLAKGGQAGAPTGVDHQALCLAHALMSQGGAVPGTPAHPGDDPRNDVVPTVLSKGEAVLPNSVTQAADAPEKAARFVAALQARKGAEGGTSMAGHMKNIQAMKRKLAELEAKIGKGAA